MLLIIIRNWLLQAEIQNILSLGVDPSRIIYANTFKQVAFIKYASDNNVSLMTFDCENELRKIKTVLPTARYVRLFLLEGQIKSSHRVDLHIIL